MAVASLARPATALPARVSRAWPPILREPVCWEPGLAVDVEACVARAAGSAG